MPRARYSAALVVLSIALAAGAQTTTGAGGWTELKPVKGARTLYVSSSTGSDSNDGSSPRRALKSLRLALRRMRNRQPDRLLLKKGDTWRESFGAFRLSGRSPEAKLVIASYGEGPRPRLETGTGSALTILQKANVEHLAIVGLELTADGYDGTGDGQAGLNVRGTVTDLLLEDLYVHNYPLAVMLRGDAADRPSTDVTMRRCIFARNYVVGDQGHPTGIYAQEAQRVVLDGCFFYRSGHDPDVEGSIKTIFRHATYFHNQTRDITMRGNIVAEASAQGIQLRGSNSTIEDNLVLETPIAILLGGGHQQELTPGGATGTVTDNVIMHGADIGPKLARGWGIAVENIGSARVANNIIAHYPAPHPYGYPFRVKANGTVGIRELVVENNIVYDWRGFSYFDPFERPFSDNVLRGNDFQYPEPISMPDNGVILQLTSAHAKGLASSNNRFYSADAKSKWFLLDRGQTSLSKWRKAFADRGSTAKRVNYRDPDRTVASYVDQMEQRKRGSSSYHDFIARLLEQSKDSWNPAYTAPAFNTYVREGFGR